ncbi:MAG: peroxiredoxin family protein [Vicinamibacterales bacterium]
MNAGVMRCTVAAVVVLTLALGSVNSLAQTPGGVPPRVGDKAADFTLRTLDGGVVRLSSEVAKGQPIVLVVLRGWPGYQCPFCTRQFAEYLTDAPRFEAAGARVYFIYPGPGDGLQGHAETFTAAKPMPKAFQLLLDPDYTYTNAYGLRWNAPKETAYPSTFVVNANGLVTFAHTSKEHGDRVPTATVLAAVAEARRAAGAR